MRLPFDPKDVREPESPKPARRERARRRAAEGGTFEDLLGGGGDSAASAGREAGSGAGALTVSGVTALIKSTLADHTPQPLLIVGEISNCRERNGHLYLTLKDETNNIDCVMWASARRRMRDYCPQRGQQVLGKGRLDFYGPQGKLQIYLDRLDPVGQGALEQRFRELCDQLRARGYFEPARKRPLPVFANRIIAITSGSGAALQDVLNTAHRRWPGVRIDLIDVRVQGADAAEDVAAAIRAVSASHISLGVDAVILTRGGGSLEDLWAFNEPVVADAVFESAVPVVAAIGHEVDTTIAELVADMRCSTPTQAAERLVPDVRKEQEHVHQLQHRLRTSLHRVSDQARAVLERICQYELFRRPAVRVDQGRVELKHLTRQLQGAMLAKLQQERAALAERRAVVAKVEPSRRIAESRRRLDELQRRLNGAMAGRWQRDRKALAELRQRMHPLAEKRLTAERRNVDQLARQLNAVGPMSVLQRGYTYTTDENGTLLRSADELADGDAVLTHFHDGRKRSVVSDGGGTSAARPVKKKTTDSPPPAAPPGSLFGDVD